MAIRELPGDPDGWRIRPDLEDIHGKTQAGPGLAKIISRAEKSTQVLVNGSEGPEAVIISPQAFNKMRKLARQYLKSHPDALDGLE